MQILSCYSWRIWAITRGTGFNAVGRIITVHLDLTMANMPLGENGSFPNAVLMYEWKYIHFHTHAVLTVINEGYIQSSYITVQTPLSDIELLFIHRSFRDMPIIKYCVPSSNETGKRKWSFSSWLTFLDNYILIDLKPLCALSGKARRPHYSRTGSKQM